MTAGKQAEMIFLKQAVFFRKRILFFLFVSAAL